MLEGSEHTLRIPSRHAIEKSSKNYCSILETVGSWSCSLILLWDFCAI